MIHTNTAEEKPFSPGKKRIFLRIIPLLFIGAFLFFCMIPGNTSSLPDRRVVLGSENFINKFPRELRGKSLGLVINHTSVLSRGKSLLNALLAKGHRIQAVFSPEHGLFGNMEGGQEVQDGQLKGIQIHSLYGKTRKPTPEQTCAIDAFVFDIQDVGTRFYTYITTLKNVMEAAAEAKIPVYILDRPNPLGGTIIEGSLLQPEFESFIAPYPIPVRYGLTSGELAMMAKGEGWVPETVELHVVKMKKWQRQFFWKDTGLRWIPPSPNMPYPETAIIYPGTAWLGALNLNKGRGTRYPFLQFGAPWLDPASIIEKLNAGEEFGIELEAVNYIPRSLPQKALHPLYKNKICHGIYVHIRQREKFRSIRFTLSLIKALKDHYPGNSYPESRYLDPMFGNDLVSCYLKGTVSYEEILAQMEKDETLFRKMRRKYLLYK